MGLEDISRSRQGGITQECVGRGTVLRMVMWLPFFF